MKVSQIAKRFWYSSRLLASRTQVCKSSADSQGLIEAGLRIRFAPRSDHSILYV